MQTISMPGPFRGVNEHPMAQNLDQFEEAYNVEFTDGKITRMRGLELVNSSIQIKPARVLAATYNAGLLTYDFGAAGMGDRTPDVTDASGATSIALAGLSGTWTLYVGMPFPFWQAAFTIGVANAAATTLGVAWFDGRGWRESGPNVDGTASGGATFAVSGTVVWSGITDLGPGARWIPTTLLGYRLYWIRFRITAGGPLGAGTIVEIRVPYNENASAPGSSGRHLTANGCYTWQRPYGGQRVFVGADSAGFYNGWDPGNGNGMPQQYPGDSRLLELDQNDGGWKAVPLPYAAFGSHIGARWAFAAFGKNGLVATNGYGPPVMITDLGARVLQATQGTDRVTGSYMGAPPWGQFLGVLQSRLVIAGGPLTPYTIFWSHPADGPLDSDLASAPLQGANHWPADQNIDVGTDTGNKITALDVNGGNVVALTTQSIWEGPPPFINKVVDGTGCAASGSAVRIGPALFFISTDGIFRYGAGHLEKISHDIELSWRRLVLRPALFTAHAVHYRRKTCIKFWIDSFRANANNQITQYGLSYDYLRGAWSKWGFPVEFTPGGLGTAPSIGAAGSYTPDSGEEVCFWAGTIGRVLQLWRADIGLRYTYLNTSGAVAAPFASHGPVLVTKRIKLPNMARMMVKALRILAQTSGATLRVNALFDDPEWRTTLNLVPLQNPVVYLHEPTDPQYGIATGLHAATIPTDRWLGKRLVWQRVSWARKCEYVQFVLQQTVAGNAQNTLEIEAFEIDFEPVPGKLVERLRNP